MNDTEMSQYILDTFAGVDSVVNAENSFYFYNPDPNVPPDHMFPFVTLMTNDLNDEFSNLDRPSVYRVNIGVSKQTFASLFGLPKRGSKKYGTAEGGAVFEGYDFTAFDQVMPHPVYGRQYWVCVLNPSPETLESNVLPLMNEAYQLAVDKYKQKSARR